MAYLFALRSSNLIALRSSNESAAMSSNYWVILGGLQAGDKVIIDNLIKVRPGMPVTNMPNFKK